MTKFKYVPYQGSAIEARKEMLDGIKFFSKGGNVTYFYDKYEQRFSASASTTQIGISTVFYEKVEVNWVAEAEQFLSNAERLATNDRLFEILKDKEFEDERKEFIELCKLVASLNE